MTTATSPRTLLAKHYFLSLEYQADFKNHRPIERDGERLVRATRVWDPRDIFSEWLKNNSFPHSMRDRGASTHYGGRIMGAQGVLCEVIHQEIFVTEKSKGTFIGLIGSYNRVVQLLAMPAERELPDELISVLQELNYTALKHDSPHARSMHDRFFQD